MARETRTPNNDLGFPIRLHPATITFTIKLYVDIDGSQPTHLSPDARAIDIVHKLLATPDDIEFLLATQADTTVSVDHARLTSDDNRVGKWIVIEDEDGILLV